MFRSIDDLGKRVVIDTNVLLDAAFVVDGYARKCISALLALGFSPTIDGAIEAEAVQKLSELGKKYCRSVDVVRILIDFVVESKILLVDPAPELNDTLVNRRDVHVVSAAKHYGAWVLTSDVPLSAELQISGVQCRSPFDVVAAERMQKNGLALDLIIHATAPSRQQGLFFGRVVTGQWAGTTKKSKHAICDVENVGRLFYDTNSEQWTFALQTGDAVALQRQLKPNELWTVCATYRLLGQEEESRISIRAARSTTDSMLQHVAVQSELSGTTVGRMTFGSSVQGAESWGGHIRCVVVGPQGMGRRRWRCLLDDPDAVPNPYDSDALSAVLRQIGSQDRRIGRIVLPTLRDLQALDL